MMAREIKFRAWLQGKHDSINFGFDGFMDYDVTIQNGQWCSVESGWDIQGQYKSIPLMQSTGLTDKNGKEIYEGDIITALMETPPRYDNPDDYVHRIKEQVKFEYGSFLIGLEYLWSEHIGDIEVIGNIYENPELLECK